MTLVLMLRPSERTRIAISWATMRLRKLTGRQGEVKSQVSHGY
jgi:hypothetical protein